MNLELGTLNQLATLPNNKNFEKFGEVKKNTFLCIWK